MQYFVNYWLSYQILLIRYTVLISENENQTFDYTHCITSKHVASDRGPWPSPYHSNHST